MPRTAGAQTVRFQVVDAGDSLPADAGEAGAFRQNDRPFFEVVAARTPFGEVCPK